MRGRAYGASPERLTPLDAGKIDGMLFAIEIDQVMDLPAHPLIVHMPVVMVPLAVTAAAVAVVARPWRAWLLPLTAILAVGGAIGVQLAIWSGEPFEERVEGGDLVDRHEDLALQARPIVLLFAFLAVAAAVIALLAQRERAAVEDGPEPDGRRRLFLTATVPAAILSVLAGTAATVLIAQTGHSGAKAVHGGDGDEEKNEDEEPDEPDEPDDDGGGDNSGPGG